MYLKFDISMNLLPFEKLFKIIYLISYILEIQRSYCHFKKKQKYSQRYTHDKGRTLYYFVDISKILYLVYERKLVFCTYL
jgi:hypothetical protein